MLTVPGNVCIKRTTYRIIRWLLIIGCIIMLVFSIIGQVHDKRYFYEQSDVDEKYTNAAGVCSSFPQCTSNCSSYNTIFTQNNSQEYTLIARCSLMCSSLGSCVTMCTSCRDICVSEWTTYYHVSQHVGSGTTELRNVLFLIFGMLGIFSAFTFLPVCRQRGCCKNWGFSDAELKDNNVEISVSDNIPAFIING